MLIWSRLALVLSILLFVPQLTEQFEAPKVVAVRVLGLGAIGAALAAALARGRRARPSVRWRPLDAAMLGWIVVEGVTTLASQSPRLSVLGDADQHEGLLTSLGLAGVYLSARLGTRSPSDAERTLRWFIAAAALASAYAVFQALGLDPSPWRGTALYSAGRFTRPFGTLAHPNLLGVISSAAFAVALGAGVASRSRRWPWAVAAILFGAATVLTLSRAAWLGAVAGALVSVLASAGSLGPARGRPHRAMKLAAAGTGVLLVILFASVGMLRARFLELMAPTAGPSGSRLEIWRAALAMWRDHSWLGVGPDAFGLFFPRYQTPEFWRYEWGVWHFHAHSIYLHLLATRGLVGALAAGAALAALLAAIRGAWRGGAETRRPVASILGAFAAMAVAGAFGVLGTAGPAVLCVLLGTTAALDEGARSSPEPRGSALGRGLDVGSGAREGGSSSPRLGRRRGEDRAAPKPPRASAWVRFPWLGLVVAIAAFLPQTAELRASRAALYAREYMPRTASETADPTSTLAADRAVKLLPGSDRLASLRAEVYLAHVISVEPDLEAERDSLRSPALASRVEGWLAEAERSARRAIALEPRRAINYQTLGNVLLARARLGDRRSTDAALAAYRGCWERSPVNALAMLQFSYETLGLGRPDLAIGPARRAASLYPDRVLPQAVLGEASLALGDTATAIAALGRALAGDWQAGPYARADLARQLETLRARR